MLIEKLAKASDEYAMRLAQGRTFSHNVRKVEFVYFKEDPMSLAEKAKAKAAALRAAKSGKKSATSTTSAKPAAKSAKKSGKKAERVSTRVQIKDAKGKIVTGRDNSFVCPECKSEITGPWSFKTHLVKQHGYSRKKAGLREE